MFKRSVWRRFSLCCLHLNCVLQQKTLLWTKIDFSISISPLLTRDLTHVSTLQNEEKPLKMFWKTPISNWSYPNVGTLLASAGNELCPLSWIVTWKRPWLEDLCLFDNNVVLERWNLCRKWRKKTLAKVLSVNSSRGEQIVFFSVKSSGGQEMHERCWIEKQLKSQDHFFSLAKERTSCNLLFHKQPEQKVFVGSGITRVGGDCKTYVTRITDLWM